MLSSFFTHALCKTISLYCTCGHVKEEGENASSVITSPQDSPRSIKRERKHSTGEFTGASFHFLPSGDVHHLQVVFTVANLGTANKGHIYCISIISTENTSQQNHHAVDGIQGRECVTHV